MRKQKGFTLVELLVVIAIIGLLSTLAVVALNQARAKARDARRISDVKQVQTALEMYFNDQGWYPTEAAGAVLGDASNACFDEDGFVAACDATGVTYMDRVPANPTPDDDGDCASGYDYTYTAAAAASTYSLEYCLGAPTGGIDAGINTANPQGISMP